MSELKAYLCIEAKEIEHKDFLCYRFTSATKSAPEACMEEVYLKSEADKVIEEMSNKLDDLRYTVAVLRKDKSYQKYKRCLNMAKRCFTKANYHYVLARHGEDSKENIRRSILYFKWNNRWLKIA